jgi:ElaB/YqjD/DUF883 family membrane-anchored ribosome-binding protein
MPQTAGKISMDDEVIAASGNAAITTPATPQPLSRQETEESSARSAECLDEARHRTSDLVDSAMQSVTEAYRLARVRGTAAYGRVSLAAQNLTRDARDRAAQLKREKPFTLLALVAGAALVLGFVVRIGRRHHHA